MITANRFSRAVSLLLMPMALFCVISCAGNHPPRPAGVMGDGKVNDTPAIQKALDSAANSGGVVRLPAGTYVCGSLFMKSGVTLRLDKGAMIKGSLNEADYPIIDTRIAGLEMKHPAALVNAIDAKNVAIVGEGTIDGSGQKWWNIFARERKAQGRGVDFKVLRPRLVCFTRCDGVKVSGVTLQNSAFWTLHILYSQNVDIEGLTIRALGRIRRPVRTGSTSIRVMMFAFRNVMWRVTMTISA